MKAARTCALFEETRKWRGASSGDEALNEYEHRKEYEAEHDCLPDCRLTYFFCRRALSATSRSPPGRCKAP